MAPFFTPVLILGELYGVCLFPSFFPLPTLYFFLFFETVSPLNPILFFVVECLPLMSFSQLFCVSTCEHFFDPPLLLLIFPSEYPLRFFTKFHQRSCPLEGDRVLPPASAVV